MPKGYQLFFAAIVGWLALCGAQPPAKQAESGTRAQQAAPAPQPATPPSPAATSSPSAKFTPYPRYDPDPCYHAEDHDAADLCAQWRASIAAEKAAHEARRSSTWSIVATILNIVGLLFVAAALSLTVQSNRIARDTARRQLRAYVVIADIVVLQDRPQFSVKVVFENTGETPATYVASHIRLAVTEGPERLVILPDLPDLDGWIPGSVSILGRHGKDHGIGEFANDKYIPTEAALAQVAKGEWTIHCYGFVVYRDVFQGDHITYFRGDLSKDSNLGAGVLTLSPDGNFMDHDMLPVGESRAT